MRRFIDEITVRDKDLALKITSALEREDYSVDYEEKTPFDMERNRRSSEETVVLKIYKHEFMG